MILPDKEREHNGQTVMFPFLCQLSVIIYSADYLTGISHCQAVRGDIL